MPSSKIRLLILISLFCLASLAGCGNIETELQHANDPSHAISLLGAIATTVLLIDFFFGRESSFQHKLYNSVLYTGAVCIVGAPIYYLSTHSIQAGAAALVSGLAAIGVCKTVLKDWK